MLYSLLKLPARFAMKIYCRRLKINHPELLQSEGPLLIAANHPNSFLDAIIVATLFRRPVYSLVRGDVYRNPFYARILNALLMLPVYRMSEGQENLGLNYGTFERCRNIFLKKGIVLIFSEGRSINEWKMRPLMKGTARLALSSWEAGIPLRILPLGINYQSFLSFGKNIELNFGKAFGKEILLNGNSYGQSIQLFNNHLKEALIKLVANFSTADHEHIVNHFKIQVPFSKRILLFPFYILGAFLHAPLFLPVKLLCLKKALHNDHYDSVMTGLLFFGYPIYLILAGLVLYALFSSIILALLPLTFPFLAWSHVQLKNQFSWKQ